MNPVSEVTLSLAAIEAELAGLPPRLADAPRLHVGSAAPSEVYAAAVTARAVVDELERRRVVGGQEREGPKSQAQPRQARPTWHTPGLAKAAEDARRTLRDAEAVAEGQGRWVAVRVRSEIKDACEEILADVLRALGRPVERWVNRPPNLVFVRHARPDERADVYTLTPALAGFYTPRDEVFINTAIARDPDRLVATIAHEACHAAGLGEEEARRIAEAVRRKRGGGR